MLHTSFVISARALALLRSLGERVRPVKGGGDLRLLSRMQSSPPQSLAAQSVSSLYMPPSIKFQPVRNTSVIVDGLKASMLRAKAL